MITKKKDIFTNSLKLVAAENSHKSYCQQRPHETAAEMDLLVNELHLFKNTKELGMRLAK